MGYFDDLEGKWRYLIDWLSLRAEQGASHRARRRELAALLEREAEELEREGPPEKLARREPTDLEEIRALRPSRRPRLKADLSASELEDRLLGAWLGRAAGCILGIPCEGMSKEGIRNAAGSFGMEYPLEGYWQFDPKPQLGPDHLHYSKTPRKEFLEGNVRRIGADDDLTYTLLGLLILEEYGPDFTPREVSQAWLDYLPMACTAERVALENLRRGVRPPGSARRCNPYREWIGADIRSDPWGYAAPGLPEKAAGMAWRDAVVSHTGAGVHGEMFFSAAIAAAFAVDHPIDAIRAGLREIPKECRPAKAVKSALQRCSRDGDWDKTTDGILSKYEGMSMAHTLNNAELTVAGIHYGGGDFEKTIAMTVMAGLDTDCTAATAGSILGAVLGAKRLPGKWTAPLGDEVQSYIKGRERWSSKDVARRFAAVAANVLAREGAEGAQ